MALPWMESLTVWGDTPPAGVQPASEAPVRLAVLFAGNGFHSKEWWVKGEGKEMELGKVLSPLADFREKMLFIRGLFNAEAQKGNIHSSQTGNLLSGAPLAHTRDTCGEFSAHLELVRREEGKRLLARVPSGPRTTRATSGTAMSTSR